LFLKVGENGDNMQRSVVNERGSTKLA